MNYIPDNIIKRLYKLNGKDKTDDFLKDTNNNYLTATKWQIQSEIKYVYRKHKPYSINIIIIAIIIISIIIAYNIILGYMIW